MNIWKPKLKAPYHLQLLQKNEIITYTLNKTYIEILCCKLLNADERNFLKT